MERERERESPNLRRSDGMACRTQIDLKLPDLFLQPAGQASGSGLEREDHQWFDLESLRQSLLLLRNHPIPARKVDRRGRRRRCADIRGVGGACRGLEGDRALRCLPWAHPPATDADAGCLRDGRRAFRVGADLTFRIIQFRCNNHTRRWPRSTAGRDQRRRRRRRTCMASGRTQSNRMSRSYAEA